VTQSKRPVSPLAFLGPQWFSPVLGWCGLALAWHRAQAGFGPVAELVALGCTVFAALIFVAVSGASVVRANRHRAALDADLAHPVRHAFVAALPVSIILLATCALALGAPRAWIAPAWLAGVVLQATATVWVIGRWIGGRVQWPALTPVLFIPIVGNILVPLAGVPLGYTGLSWMLFGVGAFFWPVVTTLVLARLAHQPMPEALLPSWFITIAPPAVGGVAATSLGMSEALLPSALGVSGLFAASCLLRVPAMLRAPFAMPAWAVSFPLAALTALTLHSASVLPAATAFGTVLLAVTSVVIGGLTLATIKGLRAGTLLAPEPVATIATAAHAEATAR
jgi:tellurite resistance protein